VRGKTQCLRLFRDRKRFGVVSGGALVGVIDGGKKLHAELHVVPSFFVPRAWGVGVQWLGYRAL